MKIKIFLIINLLMIIFIVACAKSKTSPLTVPSPTEPASQPVHTTVIQPEDPNTLGFAKYPDYTLDSIPSIPISVKYLVEHRSALDGKTITVRGIVVGILSKEAACPPDRGACGSPMIFLADTSSEDRDKYLDIAIRVNDEDRGYTVGEKVEVKVIVSGHKTGLDLTKSY